MTFDVAALASIAGLHDSRGNVPLDFCIPRRTSREPPPTVSCEEICVLLYVDGVTSLGRIAEETTFSLPETIAIILGLHTQGLVSLDDRLAPRPQPAPTRVQ